MSKQYETLAQEIVDLIGGKGNVTSLHHCQTRLRFQLADNNKADKEAIAQLDGVVQCLINGGMFQVVIGMHVAEVYEEVVKLLDIKICFQYLLPDCACTCWRGNGEGTVGSAGCLSLDRFNISDLYHF